MAVEVNARILQELPINMSSGNNSFNDIYFPSVDPLLKTDKVTVTTCESVLLEELTT
jgi:hypothetical protein